MAYLESRRRKRPQTGRVETWWRIVDRQGGRGANREGHPLGYMTEAEAKQALKVYTARHVLGERLPRFAPGSGSTVREWWGSTDRPEGEALPSRIQLVCDARGLSASERGVVSATRALSLQVAGDVPVSDLTTAHGDALLAAMRSRGLRRRTMRAYLRWWHLALDVAVADGILATVPRVTLAREAPRARAHRWHTPPQSVALFAAMRRRVDAGEVPLETLALVVMAVEGMLRPGEARTRRWEDVDWSEEVVYVRPVPLPDDSTWRPKAESERPIALTPPMAEVLRELWVRRGQPSVGWIAPSPGAPEWPVGSFRRALRETCRRAGLPELHPHALRHTAAQRLLAGGATLDALTAAGGWSTPETPTRIYLHPDRSAGLAAQRAISTRAPLGAPQAPAGEVVAHPATVGKPATNNEK